MVLIKILFAAHLKQPCVWPSANVKLPSNDLVHAIPWQCMFALTMHILQSPCIFYNLYAYTTITMHKLQSLCIYYNLYAYTTITMHIPQFLCLYYNIYANTTISMHILQSLCIYHNLYDLKRHC